MFANLKKKLEEGGVVSPGAAERRPGSNSTVASSVLKTQSTSCVHGEGLCS